ncbi:M56 family metallopeptidase [Pseudoalteromonas sp. T1lg48]|uniref:M56 family metallopeptidase n=1 Tax=Pseudoalteromonas sp. T1lg48 TaxID=2077100 RepID=UPI000CF6F08C|nr:M56 family metallopeptidase [Pseudoalteromonas sp. T1lg48]
MTDYFLTSLFISLCALGALKGLQSAPARLSFYVSVVALSSWLVPWQHMPEVSTYQQDPGLTFNVAHFWQTAPSQGQQQDALATQVQAPVSLVDGYTFDVSHLVFLALIIGVALFIWRIGQYFSFIKRLYRHSTPCNRYEHSSGGYPVRVAKLGAPAFASGVTRPTIWLDRALLDAKEVHSIIQHEATHLRQGDVYWSWAICLLECLFWWNPLCLFLAKKSKQQLELSCDEKCAASFREQYQLDLASVLLSQHQAKNGHRQFMTPLLSIAQQQSFNVQRIKMLDKEKTMNKKHVIALVMSLAFSAVAAAQIVDKDKPQQVQAQQTAISYEEQMAALLDGAAEAKSKDVEKLNKVFANILHWHANRAVLNEPDEGKIKLLSFTLLSHVGHKLARYEDVMFAFADWYPDADSAPYFLKNVTALTHLQLQQPNLAINELNELKAQLKSQTKPGTLMNLARSYIEVEDFDNALAILEQLPEDNKYTAVLKYYVYFHQGDSENMERIKAQLPTEVASLPPSLPDFGIPMSPLLAKL